MLHAVVGSRRIAQGILQLYFAASSSCTALPFRLALVIKFWKISYIAAYLIITGAALFVEALGMHKLSM